ncbi:unnamed protein product [Prorocentrum cordatum]|uniref:Uncharacterized protein n=1 Tax=Prorocentrum cordatum TaxID=2364126 RepID=A0ABN9TDG2_9DINO|nr:unnamed protein product [Polarella glacialis]
MALAAARRLRRRERRRPREDLGSRPARARHRGHCRTASSAEEARRSASGCTPAGLQLSGPAGGSRVQGWSRLLAPPPGTSRSTAPARAELPPVGCFSAFST